MIEIWSRTEQAWAFLDAVDPGTNLETLFDYWCRLLPHRKLRARPPGDWNVTLPLYSHG